VPGRKDWIDIDNERLFVDWRQLRKHALIEALAATEAKMI
jgi:hypothetical protein